MDKNDSLFGLKTGYGSKNKWKNEFKKLDTKITLSYPDGKVWTLLLTIVVIIGLSLSLGLASHHKYFFKTQWYNLVFYVLAATMCFIALAWVARTGFLASLRYGLLKFARLIRLDVLRRKIKYKVIYEAIDDVNSLEEFKEYIKEKNKNTKKTFIITTSVYSGLFLIWTIVMAILNALKLGR